MDTSFADPLRSALAQARERFLALSPRERWMVAVCAAAVVATVTQLGVIGPLGAAHERRDQALAAARSVAQRLEDAQALAQSGRGGQPRPATGSLLAQVDQSLKASKIGKAPERVQPEGENEVRVWLSDVPFDAVLRWMAELGPVYGVSIQTLDVERQDLPGTVDARLSLVRGG